MRTAKNRTIAYIEEETKENGPNKATLGQLYLYFQGLVAVNLKRNILSSLRKVDIRWVIYIEISGYLIK